MGSMFRSEEMALCQLFIQPEAAFASLSELGETGVVQFRDLNSNVNAFQRKFVQEVRRCDEMERKLRFIETEIKKENINLTEMKDNPRALNPREIINLEAHLEKAENELLELTQNQVNLKSNFLELTELRKVLENTEGFFSNQEVYNFNSRKSITTKDDQTRISRGHLAFVAGIIPRERVFAFETMLWRISRGNLFLRTVDLAEPLKEPSTDHPIAKTIFVAFYQGEQLKSRIKRVCTGFHASIYPCPSSRNERNEMVQGVRTRLEDLKMVLNQTEDHKRRVLVSVSKELPNWKIMVKKMKAIYHTLNLCNMDVTKKCLIGECWVPANDLHIVQKALSNGSFAVESTIPSFLNVIQTNEIPPTFNPTNKFTKGFQNLIDSYGVSSYREVNPALYTIVTFPFLFAIMFGDVGHGIIMSLFAGWMVGFEKKLSAKKTDNEIWNIFFGGRYIILLMGIFSIYTGAIYNDVFSKSLNIFGSNWRINYNYTWTKNAPLILDPAEDLLDKVYPFGMDPVWQMAENKLIFLNSYKMKLSIIFGVIHMTFAVCMSVVNHVHLKKHINILLEFIPQIVFLLILFGYMVFMMFFKWAIYDAKNEELIYQPRCAPSVLILFINMVLFKHTKPFEGCKEYMFDGQDIMQSVFVGVALVCIPWLLLAKPIYIMLNRKRRPRATYNGDINNGLEIKPESEGGHTSGDFPESNEDEEEPFSEIFIQQAIHTVEYILNTVSHTASYLRLWALSLAHAQLSEVLWSRLFSLSLSLFPGYINVFFIFVIFPVWAMFTIAILVLMEGLSAFLHTLRLHWVEFMSKFYDGTGYPFQPFCFKTILDSEDDEEYTK